MDLDHIFQYHAPQPGQPEKYEKLRSAFKAYAEALTSERSLTEDGDLVLELAYEDIVKVYTELVPDSPEGDRALHFINEAYDLAVDPNRAIVQMVQAASMFSNAAIAINS